MWNNLKRLLTANPMGVFIWGIIGKWYIMILIASVIVLFWTFKGLETAGVFAMAERAFSKGINDIKWVAKECVPRITNRDNFWQCLQTDFGQYEETDPNARNLQDRELEIRTHFREHKENTNDGIMRGTEDIDPYEIRSTPHVGQ